MPNRREHDHIGQLRQKLGIRIGRSTASKVITNLKELADLNITIQQIDKIVTNVINNSKFLDKFITNAKQAAASIGIRVG